MTTDQSAGMILSKDEKAMAMWAGVQAAPSNALAKLVLADRCDEIGWPRLAHCFRWCAKWNKHPLRVITPKFKFKWCWF